MYAVTSAGGTASISSLASLKELLMCNAFQVLALVAVAVAAVSATVDIKAWRSSIKHPKTGRRGEVHTLDKYNVGTLLYGSP